MGVFSVARLPHQGVENGHQKGVGSRPSQEGAHMTTIRAEMHQLLEVLPEDELARAPDFLEVLLRSEERRVGKECRL